MSAILLAVIAIALLQPSTAFPIETVEDGQLGNLKMEAIEVMEVEPAFSSTQNTTTGVTISTPITATVGAPDTIGAVGATANDLGVAHERDYFLYIGAVALAILAVLAIGYALLKWRTGRRVRSRSLAPGWENYWPHPPNLNNIGRPLHVNCCPSYSELGLAEFDAHAAKNHCYPLLPPQ